jgi:hypothetical protein
MPTKTSRRLHAAIQTGAWSTAQDLLASFRLEVEAVWRAAATDQERRTISEDVTSFLQWTRAMTMTSRQTLQNKLNGLEHRRAYAQPQVANPFHGVDA